MQKNKQIKFEVINSFATKRFEGNPAAVIKYKKDELNTNEMQKIARQLNLVETVFVTELKDKKADYLLRYFTPIKELPIAGHPTIAAWTSIINSKNKNQIKNQYIQKTKKGLQNILIEQNENLIIKMKQPEPKIIKISETNKEIAKVFSLSDKDITSSPVLGIDTGLGHIVFEVKNLNVLNKIKRNINGLKKLCQKYNLSEAQIFCKQTYNKKNSIHTRNICPREGIEDPACGIGTGALICYLLYTQKENKINLSVEQGNIVNMSSLIYANGKVKNNEFVVYVGGSGIKMLKGTLFLN